MRWWPSRRDSLVIVQPATVLRWRRNGWSGLSRYRSRGRWRGGRLRIEREVHQLITRMARENFLWGAPRIHGELRMLGFSVSQATVSRYMPAASRRPRQSWQTFLRNQALAFRFDEDSASVSGVDYRSRHAWFCRSRLGRFAVAQIALVGTRRGRCGGSPLTLPNTERISYGSCSMIEAYGSHGARRLSAAPSRSRRAPVIVVRLRYRCAVHRLMRGRRHAHARRQFGSRWIASKSSGRLTSPPSRARLNAGFPRAD